MATGLPSTLGQRIADLRERRGLTQRQLAEAADLSATFLSEIENDRRNVGAAILLRLADTLDASLDYLMRGEEDRAPRKPITIPPELSAAAEKEGWSYSQTVTLLEGRVLHRRGGTSAELAGRQWTTQEWIAFYRRLFADP